MKPEPLATVEIEPEAIARWAVIWLHGLGADGHDFEPIVPLLGLQKAGVRFVFPHAPLIPVTLNLGEVMRAWYDLSALDDASRVDHEGLLRSVQAVTDLVRRERERGIPADRIVLAGFSQGGSVALRVGLGAPEPLAGLVLLSTYLVEDGSERVAEGLRIFQGHGTYDPVVPYAWGVQARDRLIGWGATVTWKSYPIEHAVSPEEIEDLAAWLQELMAMEK